MHHLLLGSANKNRRDFYNNIFEKNLNFAPSEKIWEGLNTLGCTDGKAEFLAGKCQVHSLFSVWMTNVQYLFIKQSKETRELIADAASEKMTAFLKIIYAENYGTDESEIQHEYLKFLQATVKESLLTDYEEEKLIKFVNTLRLYESLMTKVHPALVTSWHPKPTFQPRILNKALQLAGLLGISVDATKIINKVYDDNTDVVIKMYSEITVHEIPHKPLLAGLLVAATSMLMGMPYLAAFIAIADAAVYGLYAIAPYRSPELTKETKETLIRIGKVDHVLNVDPSKRKKQITEDYAISNALREIRNTLLEGRVLKKKIIKVPKVAGVVSEDREVFIPSNDVLETIPDLSLTQRKKIKGKRTVVASETPALPTTTAKIKRLIVVPESADATLVEGDNNSLLLIQNPSPTSGITKEDMDNMMGPRGVNFAKSFGQSGIKLLKGKNAGFWIKDHTTDVRITLKEMPGMKVTVDGQEQTVPVLKPECMAAKNKLKRA